MFFATHKLRIQLEEMKHKHGLEVAEMRATVDREKKHWNEDKRREMEKLQQEHDLKLKEVLTLTKLDAEQRIKKAELEAESKFNDRVEKLNKEHYDKLATAMTKLHEEGNVTTKFTQDLALKMIGNMPEQKNTTKVLTGSIDVGPCEPTAKKRK